MKLIIEFDTNNDKEEIEMFSKLINPKKVKEFMKERKKKKKIFSKSFINSLK